MGGRRRLREVEEKKGMESLLGSPTSYAPGGQSQSVTECWLCVCVCVYVCVWQLRKRWCQSGAEAFP